MGAKRLVDQKALELLHHLFERSATSHSGTHDHVFDLSHALREQIGGDDAVGLDLNHETLNLVLELSHIARPLMGEEHLHGLLREAAGALSDLA